MLVLEVLLELEGITVQKLVRTFPAQAKPLLSLQDATVQEVAILRFQKERLEYTHGVAALPPA